jgi:hypothetical protein
MRRFESQAQLLQNTFNYHNYHEYFDFDFSRGVHITEFFSVVVLVIFKMA